MRSTKKTIIWTRAGFIKFSGLRQGYIYIYYWGKFFFQKSRRSGGGRKPIFLEIIDPGSNDENAKSLMVTV